MFKRLLTVVVIVALVVVFFPVDLSAGPMQPQQPVNQKQPSQFWQQVLDPIQLLTGFLQSQGVTLPVFNWNWSDLKEKSKNKLCGGEEPNMKRITPKPKIPPTPEK